MCTMQVVFHRLKSWYCDFLLLFWWDLSQQHWDNMLFTVDKWKQCKGLWFLCALCKNLCGPSMTCLSFCFCIVCASPSAFTHVGVLEVHVARALITQNNYCTSGILCVCSCLTAIIKAFDNIRMRWYMHLKCKCMLVYMHMNYGGLCIIVLSISKAIRLVLGLKCPVQNIEPGSG